MPTFSHAALQAALYSRLSGDAALMTLVTGVYDFVPADAAYPYVTLGEMSGEDASTATTAGMRFNFSLRVYSREAGRKKTAQIMERIHTLLHLVNISVSGQSLVMLRLESSDITLGNDGLTYVGSLRFRAIVEAA